MKKRIYAGTGVSAVVAIVALVAMASGAVSVGTSEVIELSFVRR